MIADDPNLILRLATEEHDLRAAQRLRYEVFVAELGADGPMVDHDARLEQDRYDPFFDHLVLIDRRRNPDALEHVVGVYRLMGQDRARQVGQFYTEDEYDLTPLFQSGRQILELGRSCVHRDYRGGPAMMLLWSGLADYVLDRGAEVLFGVASFHGTDPTALAQPLSLLHHRHLAPPELRVVARESGFQRMDLVADPDIDRPNAIKATPALIKAYLRLGGFVGEGAYLDHDFNTTDVCLVMDTARMNEKSRAIYARGRA